MWRLHSGSFLLSLNVVRGHVASLSSSKWCLGLVFGALDIQMERNRPCRSWRDEVTENADVMAKEALIIDVGRVCEDV